MIVFCFRSFGVVVWELLHCEIPYRDVDSSAVIWGIGSNSLMLPIPSSCPDGLKLLMRQCWSSKPKNRPSFRHILMHLDIAAPELVNIDPAFHYQVQEMWREEIRNALRVKCTSRNTLSSDGEDEAELIRRRKEELQHAQDIREHYERRLERVNNLYMELTACLLQLEKREEELIQREQLIYGRRANKRRIVGPLIQAAQEKVSYDRKGTYRPHLEIENSFERNGTYRPHLDLENSDEIEKTYEAENEEPSL